MTRSTLPARRAPALPAGELADLRRMLEEQRAFRVEQLTQLHLPGPRGPLGSADPEILTSLATGARAALHDVQAALWRMDEGRYGLCTACGEPIERGAAGDPAADRRCMTCQRAACGGRRHPVTPARNPRTGTTPGPR